jgi:hypothetical protein
MAPMQILAATILAVGALLGIWLGAYYAAGRLRAQLHEQALWFNQQRGEEAERLDKQLQAESERLERQLVHDRRMRDLDELRAVLDDAAGAIAQSINAILTARGATPVLGYEVDEDFQEDEEGRKERTESLSAAHIKTWALAPEVQRLRLRFGPAHTVTESFRSIRDGLVDLVQAVDVGAELWTIEQEAHVDELQGIAGRLNTAFIDACRGYTAVAEPWPSGGADPVGV